MHEIECEGRDEVRRTFVYADPYKQQLLGGYHELSFTVKAHENDSDSLDLDLRERGNGELWLRSITHYGNPKFSAKGIPDALLPCLSKRYGVRICSGKTWGAGEITQEFLSVDATKMWKRLVEKGLAEYSEREDVYRIILPA